MLDRPPWLRPCLQQATHSLALLPEDISQALGVSLGQQATRGPQGRPVSGQAPAGLEKGQQWPSGRSVRANLPKELGAALLPTSFPAGKFFIALFLEQFQRTADLALLLLWVLGSLGS